MFKVVQYYLKKSFNNVPAPHFKTNSPLGHTGCENVNCHDTCAAVCCTIFWSTEDPFFLQNRCQCCQFGFISIGMFGLVIKSIFLNLSNKCDSGQ